MVTAYERRVCLFPFFVLALMGCQNKKTEPQPSSVVAAKTDLSALTAEVSGAVMGKPFKPDQVQYQGRKLSFRTGKEVFADKEISFELPPSFDPKLAAREWTFGGDQADNTTILLSVKEGQGLPRTEFVFPADYRMTLKIAKRTSKSLEGIIDLRVSKPGNTHLTGTFAATITKTAAEAPDDADAPYVCGKIVMMDEWQQEFLTAGFAGKGTDGKHYANGSGTRFTPGGGNEWATSGTFKPQLTSIFNPATSGLGYKHVKLAPGDYVIFVRRGDVAAAWKKVAVKAGDQLTVDLTIDLARMGSVLVTLPDEEANDRIASGLALVPLEIDRSNLGFRNAFRAAGVKKGNKTVTVKGVPAGKYLALRGKSEAEVEVAAGKETAVTLVRSEPKK